MSEVLPYLHLRATLVEGEGLRRPDGELLPLEPEVLLVAQWLDGHRPPADRWAHAAQNGIEASRSRDIEAWLGQHAVLGAGRVEPIPVPRNSLAWPNRDRRSRPMRANRASTLVPSTVPGSLAQPALVGGLHKFYVGAEHDSSLDRPLPAGPFIALGRFFAWPVIDRRGGWMAVLLLISLLAAVWGHRFAWWDGAAQHIRTGGLWWSLPMGVVLINLVSQASCAYAVARLSASAPRIGLTWGRPPVPAFKVDSRGIPELSRRSVRLRIIAAPVIGSLGLLGVVMLLWLVNQREGGALTESLTALMTLITVSVLIRANPLARYDGYAFLSHWLGMPDLKQQSFFAILGKSRPWQQQLRPLTQRWLRAYYVATFLFGSLVLLMIGRYSAPALIEATGALGFLAILAVIGVVMFKQLGRPPMPRDGLGWDTRWQRLKAWRPTRRQGFIFGGILLLCLFPYRYEPSGDLEVLPLARADVRALVPGDIREVLVAEGDIVAAGQPLVRIADAEQRAKVAASEANLAQLRADLTLLEKGAREEEIEVARSRVATLTKRNEFSRGSADRLARAYRQGGVSVEDFDRARGTAEVDAQLLAEAQRALELLTSPARDENIKAVQAQIAREEALLAFHREQLAQTELTAPIAGRVVSSGLQFAVGRYLDRGEVLAVIEDAGLRQAEIQLPESAVGEVAVGRPATAKVWAYPGTEFEGEVTAIAPAAEAARYGKVVRVQISLRDEEDRLKSGMTGVGKAAGERHIALIVFTRALWRFLLVEVWSWLP